MKRKKLNLQRIIHRKDPISGRKPSYLIVFLHGYGANGADLFDLSNAFSNVMPDAYFLAPDAPNDCAMSPLGKEWFPIEKIPLGAVEASKEFLNFIKKEAEKIDINLDKVILIGFSQGSMMSLQSILMSEEKFCAVIGYSGGLQLPNIECCRNLIHDGKHIHSNTPVLLVHGEEDQVVPFESLNLTKNILSNIGFDVKILPCPLLGHGINPEGISEGIEFLKNINS